MSARYRKASPLVGNGAYAAGQLIVLVLFVALSTLDQLGVYSLALAVTAPIQLTFAMRLRAVRVVGDPSRPRFGTYVRLSLATSGLAIGISVLIAVAWPAIHSAAAVVLVVAIAKALECQIDLCYGEVQRLDRLDVVAISQILRSVSMVALSAIALALGGGAVGVSLVMVLVALSALLLHDYPRLRKLWRERRAETLPAERPGGELRLLREAWPMGVSAGLTSLNGALPRVIAFAELGAHDAGILALLMYPTTVMSLAATSLGQGALTSMRDARTVGDPAEAQRIASELKRPLLLLGAVGVLLLIVFGEALLGLLIPGADAMLVLTAVLLLCAATVGAASTVSYYVLTSAGRYGFHPVVSAGVTVVTLPALLVGAGQFGLPGLAGGVLLAMCVQYLLWTMAGKRVPARTSAEPLGGVRD